MVTDALALALVGALRREQEQEHDDQDRPA
jgi:hypothetical protein